MIVIHCAWIDRQVSITSEQALSECTMQSLTTSLNHKSWCYFDASQTVDSDTIDVVAKQQMTKLDYLPVNATFRINPHFPSMLYSFQKPNLQRTINPMSHI